LNRNKNFGVAKATPSLQKGSPLKKAYERAKYTRTTSSYALASSNNIFCNPILSIQKTNICRRMDASQDGCHRG